MRSIIGNSRRADITFQVNGRIHISARLATLLQLAPGDVIDMMEGACETYLYVRFRAPVLGRHEGTVFRSNKRGNHFCACSVKLCSFMFGLCRGNGKKLSLPAGAPVQLSIYGTAVPIIKALHIYDSGN